MVPNSLPNLDSAWHTLDADKALHQFQTNRTIGLTHQQVTDRLQTYGFNELEEGEGRSNWTILIDQFKNIMLLMLIAVALISGTLDLLDLINGSLKSGDIPFKDTIAILAIVILNGALGYIQESRAEKALAALKQLSSPKVRVLRDRKISEIDSKNLVVGDVMFVEAGVQIAADGRLLEEANLQIRESALTGEAHAVNKQANLMLAADAPLGDRINLVYQGTEVLQGRGTVLVTGTGMRTELGKIAAMLQGVESEPTPLQLRMDQLSQALVTGALALVAVVVGVGFLAAVVSAGGDINAGIKNLRDLLQVSLSMAVAVVPEGLPAVITVTLAIGTQRMVRRNALIRKLPAVETLGSVTTICSDKTGTLTQNKMVVQSLHTASFSPQVTGEGYIPTGNFYADSQITPSDYPELQALLLACTVCNDSILQTENGQWQILGDPTEGALLVVASKGGFEQDQWNHKLPRVAEFPFSSERKRMSVIVAGGESRMQTEVGLAAPYLMFTKGSPELILERCQQVQIDDRIQPLTDEHRQRVLDRNNQLASKGLRVLGFAYKPLETLPPENSSEQTEQGLVWLGLVDMLDAPRPEVRDAVARCRTAGIRPVMITGDHQLTAMAIAEDLGIAQAGDRVITGRELETISLIDLEQIVNQVSVYARVAPEHKLRIVQALQRQNKIVAMTGDGVNDAPALKQADIGIAMGITGTDVSKEASDMVLLDDNFATIVAATEEGRVVYTNIRRFIKYILGSNIGEVLTIAASPLLLPTGGGVPLSPLQILWMNLVTDGLPALALAVEPAEPNVMQRPPNHPGESIFARGLGSYMVRVGIVLAILAIILMVWAFNHTHAPGYTGDPEAWKTMVFTTLCLAQMGHAIAIRSNTQLSIQISPFTNPYVWAAVGVTTLLQFALIYIEPLRKFFGTHLLSAQEVWVCIGFSMLMFVWIELEKVFINRFKRGSRQDN